MEVLDTLIGMGIPESAVDKDSLSDIVRVSGASAIGVLCGCGAKKTVKVVSVLRTVRRSGVYRCMSCSITEKHKDPAYQKSHSAGIIESWTPEKREKQSAISKDLWSDPSFAEKVTDSSTEAWKSPERRELASVRAVSLWENPEYRARYGAMWASPGWREEDSKRIKAVWESPAYREKQESFKSSREHKELQSDLAKRRWEDPTYRSMVVESMELLWSDPLLRKAMSDKVLELWKDPEYVEKQRLAALDPDLIKLKSDNATEQWKDPEIRASIISGIKEVWEDPDYRARASAISKKQWEDPVFREQQAIKRGQILAGGKDSILERTTQALLTALGIQYVRHHVIGYFEFDLFIPGSNLLIECNGEYWHSLRKPADAAKFTHISEYHPQYRVLYLWERDFMNPGLIRQKLMAELIGAEDPSLEQRDFSFDDLTVRPLDAKEKLPHSYYSAPEEFLQSFHYAGYGRSAKSVYGAFLGPELVAVCKFATPVRQEVATSIGLRQSEVLELDRFCIHPLYQKKNFASWLVSRCSRRAFDDHPQVRTLVSFADSTFGHTGVIYRAANWSFVHVVRPDYHYLGPGGFVIHKKTLWDHARKNGHSEADYVAANGYIKVFGKEKLKFSLARTV
jgi:GNAT superfamily N-acetyltransferase